MSSILINSTLLPVGPRQKEITKQWFALQLSIGFETKGSADWLAECGWSIDQVSVFISSDGKWDQIPKVIEVNTLIKEPWDRGRLDIFRKSARPRNLAMEKIKGILTKEKWDQVAPGSRPLVVDDDFVAKNTQLALMPYQSRLCEEWPELACQLNLACYFQLPSGTDFKKDVQFLAAPHLSGFGDSGGSVAPKPAVYGDTIPLPVENIVANVPVAVTTRAIPLAITQEFTYFAFDGEDQNHTGIDLESYSILSSDIPDKRNGFADLLSSALTASLYLGDHAWAVSKTWPDASDSEQTKAWLRLRLKETARYLSDGIHEKSRVEAWLGKLEKILGASLKTDLNRVIVYFETRVKDLSEDKAFERWLEVLTIPPGTGDIQARLDELSGTECIEDRIFLHYLDWFFSSCQKAFNNPATDKEIQAFCAAWKSHYFSSAFRERFVVPNTSQGKGDPWEQDLPRAIRRQEVERLITCEYQDFATIDLKKLVMGKLLDQPHNFPKFATGMEAPGADASEEILQKREQLKTTLGPIFDDALLLLKNRTQALSSSVAKAQGIGLLFGDVQRDPTIGDDSETDTDIWRKFHGVAAGLQQGTAVVDNAWKNLNWTNPVLGGLKVKYASYSRTFNPTAPYASVSVKANCESMDLQGLQTLRFNIQHPDPAGDPYELTGAFLTIEDGLLKKESKEGKTVEIVRKDGWTIKIGNFDPIALEALQKGKEFQIEFTIESVPAEAAGISLKLSVIFNPLFEGPVEVPLMFSYEGEYLFAQTIYNQRPLVAEDPLVSGKHGTVTTDLPPLGLPIRHEPVLWTNSSMMPRLIYGKTYHYASRLVDRGSCTVSKYNSVNKVVYNRTEGVGPVRLESANNKVWPPAIPQKCSPIGYEVFNQSRKLTETETPTAVPLLLLDGMGLSKRSDAISTSFRMRPPVADIETVESFYTGKLNSEIRKDLDQLTRNNLENLGLQPADITLNDPAVAQISLQLSKYDFTSNPPAFGKAEILKNWTIPTPDPLTASVADYQEFLTATIEIEGGFLKIKIPATQINPIKIDENMPAAVYKLTVLPLLANPSPFSAPPPLDAQIILIEIATRAVPDPNTVWKNLRVLDASPTKASDCPAVYLADDEKFFLEGELLQKTTWRKGHWRNISHATITRQHWNWAGFPTPSPRYPDPADSKKQISLFDSGKVTDDKNPNLINWEARAFLGRDTSRDREYIDRPVSQNAAIPLFIDELADKSDARYVRYAVQVFSRYQGLYNFGLDEGKSAQPDITDSSILMLPGWRRFFVPFRGEAKDLALPSPRYVLPGPVLKDRPGTGGNMGVEIVPAGLYCIFETEAFASGTGEEVEMQIVAATHNKERVFDYQEILADRNNPPPDGRLDLDARLEYGRNPLHSIDPLELPIPTHDTPFLLKGPFGYSFDLDARLPYFRACAFWFDPTDLAEVKDKAGNSLTPLPGDLLRVRFRRKSSFPNVTGNWTAPTWVELPSVFDLPDQSDVKVRDTLTIDLKKQTLKPEVKLPFTDDSFDLWLVVSKSVVGFDQIELRNPGEGRLSEKNRDQLYRHEIYEGECQIVNGTLQENILGNKTTPGERFARVVIVEKSSAAGHEKYTLWSALFGSGSVEDSQKDRHRRILDVSPRYSLLVE